LFSPKTLDFLSKLLVSLDTSNLSENAVIAVPLPHHIGTSMMPTIRIDEDIFKRLQAIAEPFTDTPNTVIRRLLDERVPTSTQVVGTNSKQIAEVRVVDHKKTNEERDLLAELDAEFGKKRRTAGLTPQPVYETFLLYVLASAFGGRGDKHEVTKAVLDSMQSRGFVSHADLERVSTGETKAANTIAWARNALKERALISRISPRGVWELTSEGKSAAQSLSLPMKE
jgi:predicted transcriptional regulator